MHTPISTISPRRTCPSWKGGVSISVMEPSRRAPPPDELKGSLMDLERGSYQAVMPLARGVAVLMEDDAHISPRQERIIFAIVEWGRLLLCPMSEIVCFPVLNFTYSHVENSLFFALDGSFFVTRKTTYGTICPFL
jgi:hypothetical protein